MTDCPSNVHLDPVVGVIEGMFSTGRLNGRPDERAVFCADCADKLSSVGLFTPDVTCTGVTARWCPVHGDCTCPQDEEGYPIGHSHRGCALHDPRSIHGDNCPD